MRSNVFLELSQISITVPLGINLGILLELSLLNGDLAMPLEMFKDKQPKGPFPGVSNLLAIAAGKGGVGKSTVTVNLALAFKQKGYRVGILDTDIYGPSIRQMLPEDRLPGKRGQQLTPAVSSGIRVMTMAYFREDHEAAIVRAPIANRVVSQFMNDVYWGELDLLLIDFPPGTGDIQLTLSQQAPLTAAVMVTTPQKVATLDVRKAMTMFHQVNVPVMGVVENMAFYQKDEHEEPQYLFGKGGGNTLAQESGVPLLGQIPLDPLICSSADEGQSLFRQAGDSSICRAFSQLADTVEQHLAALKDRQGEHLENFELTWSDR